MDGQAFLYRFLTTGVSPTSVSTIPKAAWTSNLRFRRLDAFTIRSWKRLYFPYSLFYFFVVVWCKKMIYILIFLQGQSHKSLNTLEIHLSSKIKYVQEYIFQWKLIDIVLIKSILNKISTFKICRLSSRTKAKRQNKLVIHHGLKNIKTTYFKLKSNCYNSSTKRKI